MRLPLRPARLGGAVSGCRRLQTNARPEPIPWSVFSNERDVRLNWCLAHSSITPSKGAYRNAPVDLLAPLAGSAIKDGAVSLPKVQLQKTQVLEAGMEELDYDEFDEALLATRRSLCTDRDLFVSENAVGSFRGAKVGVRIITDDPGLGMCCNNLLVSWPRSKDPRPHSLPITVYATTDGEPFGGVSYEEEPEGGSGITGALIALRGPSNQVALMHSIYMAASALLSEADDSVVGLPATTVRRGGKTGLVFGAEPKDIAVALDAGALYSA
ncbi:unnamed protein product, partial [Chrysoparadoxa australica]